MVASAHRTLRTSVGEDVVTWYPGNAPMGFWLDVYPEEKQQKLQCYGAKVFFYRAEILNGRVKLASGTCRVCIAFSLPFLLLLVPSSLSLNLIVT